MFAKKVIFHLRKFMDTSDYLALCDIGGTIIGPLGCDHKPTGEVQEVFSELDSFLDLIADGFAV